MTGVPAVAAERTQRRHVDGTALETGAAAARDPMEKAPALAGPATTGPAPQNH